MKLYRLLFFLLICTAQVSNAQVILLTELFKNDGRQVDSADSADYVRIVDAPDSAAKTVIIREFYAYGSRKSIATAISWLPIQYKGSYHSLLKLPLNGNLHYGQNKKLIPSTVYRSHLPLLA